MLVLNEDNLKINTVINVTKISRGKIQYDNFGGKLFDNHVSFKPNLYHSYLKDVEIIKLNEVSNKFKNNPIAKEIIIEDNLSFKNTYFLPFEQNQITSMDLPLKGEGLKFVTSRMAGCAFYICRNIKTNQITVCHANGISVDSLNTQSKNNIQFIPKKPSFQAIETKLYLNNLIMTFLKSNPDLVLLKSLYKEDYFKSLDFASSFFYKAGELPTEDNSSFAGSAIIVGFLNKDTWSFWLQSYMNVGLNSLNVPKNKLAPNFKQIFIDKIF